MHLNTISPPFPQVRRENTPVATCWWVVSSLKLIWPAHGHDMGKAIIFTNTDTFSAWEEGAMELFPRVPPLTTTVFFDALHACDVHFAIRIWSQMVKGWMLKTQPNGLPTTQSNSCKNEPNRTA